MVETQVKPFSVVILKLDLRQNLIEEINDEKEGSKEGRVFNKLQKQDGLAAAFLWTKSFVKIKEWTREIENDPLSKILLMREVTSSKTKIPKDFDLVILIRTDIRIVDLALGEAIGSMATA